MACPGGCLGAGGRVSCCCCNVRMLEGWHVALGTAWLVGGEQAPPVGGTEGAAVDVVLATQKHHGERTWARVVASQRGSRGRSATLT